MKDAFEREIDYLRVSLTDLCNYRCKYCMKEGGVEKKSHADMLTLEEVFDVISAFKSLGGKKVRFTGGEPLVRKGAVSLIERVGRELDVEIGLTTNGVYLPENIDRLKDVVSLVNVSIDTLDKDKYRFVTMGGNLDDALAGLKAARDNVKNVKVNAVLMRGINDESVKEFADFANSMGVTLRFIELMPFAENNAYAQYGISATEIIERYGLRHVETIGNAEYYAFADGKKVGFIRPLSNKFCKDCNRLRLTSDGKLLPCLHGEGEIDVKPYLKDGKVQEALLQAVASKPFCHNIDSGKMQTRKMNYIGG
ncbi:MAG: GTP 3',8-cyclase MoaA [Clostridia bacterium]|nr:GTP 3',8-cyclase MoaA [Clostridia bacterium]